VSMPRIKDEDVSGRRFGRLVVLAVHDVVPQQGTRVRIRCDCGAEKITYWKRIRIGETKSCGCLSADLARDRIEHVNRVRRPPKTRRVSHKQYGLSETELRFSRGAWV